MCKYSTDEIVKRVYLWCTGDDSGAKSLEEMKQIYAKLIRAKVKRYRMDGFKKLNDNEYVLTVTRWFTNQEVDTTSYSIIRSGQTWKFDNRF